MDIGKDWDFILEQLSLKVTASHGRRYSASSMNIAMNLYLNEKSCYRLRRRILALPSSNTLTANVGSFNTVDPDAEAERISKLKTGVYFLTSMEIVYELQYV